jgi:hypothetical protein
MNWQVGFHIITFEACSVFTSRYGLPTRRTAKRYICLEGSDGFAASAAAPIASSRSNRVGRVRLAPAMPCVLACFSEIIQK